MVGEHVGEALLRAALAQGVDGAGGLLAEVLRQEEAGKNDAQDDQKERDRGAEGAVADSAGEPVVGAPGDDGEDDGPEDAQKHGVEQQPAEDEDAERQKEEGDLLPDYFAAAVCHMVATSVRCWSRV